MISDTQLHTLALVKTRDVRQWPISGDIVLWDTQKQLRRSTVNALTRQGLIALNQVDGSGVQVVVTAAGDAILAEHGDLVATERIRGQAIAEHQPRYQMYTRGHHPIKGWGRGPLGCKVICSCGYERRVNEGRKAAVEDFGWHLRNMFEAKLTEAGIPLPSME